MNDPNDLNPNEIHEAYKKLMHGMLFDFLISGLTHFEGMDSKEISMYEMRKFSRDWFDAHCKDPTGTWLKNKGVNG